MNKRKNKNAIHISDILNKTVMKSRRKPGTDMTLVWNIWDSALGELISENAKPAAFKGSVLLVHVTSSTWLQHLGFLKEDIIKKLNISLQKELIRDIKFKIGKI